ncbi:unnamed protein product, partial [Cladocopium goreaui]
LRPSLEDIAEAVECFLYHSRTCDQSGIMDYSEAHLLFLQNGASWTPSTGISFEKVDGSSRDSDPCSEPAPLEDADDEEAEGAYDEECPESEPEESDPVVEECRSQQPTPSPMEVIEANPDKTVVDHTKSLSAELDQALQAGKSEEAMEIMTLLEIQHEHDKIEDEELALQMMEEELKILEMTEQLHKLEMQALEEQETIQMNYAKDLSMKDVARPPARPLVSSTPVPAVCPDLLDTLPMEFPEPFVPAVVDSAGSKSEPPETSGTMDAGSIIARQRTLKLGEVPSDDDACADHKDTALPTSVSNPRPSDVVDDLEPIKPSEQGQRKSGRGKGRGRGRGRGRGKGRCRKVEDDEENEEEDGKDSEENEEGAKEASDDNECKEPAKHGPCRAKRASKTPKKSKADKVDKADASNKKPTRKAKPAAKMTDKSAKGKAKGKTTEPAPKAANDRRKSKSKAVDPDDIKTTDTVPKKKAKKHEVAVDEMPEADKADENQEPTKTRKSKTKVKKEKEEKASSSTDVPKVPKRKAKDLEGKAPKGSPKRSPKGDSKATDPQAAKQRQSRKSSAYHKAKLAATKAGKSPEEANKLAKEAVQLKQHSFCRFL